MSWIVLFSVAVERPPVTSFLTKDGREFHARAAATGNARSPRVRRRVAGTINVDMAADLRRWQELRLVVNCKVSARYRGTVPWRHRKARTQSRNFILSGTLNQWISQSSGVMCSYLLAENTSRAAAFNTDCSRLSRVSESDTPANTELQQSTLLTTSAWIKVIIAFVIVVFCN